MHQVNYGTQDLFFEVTYSDRKTLAIEVHPDSSIVVVAPISSELSDIKKRIVKKGQWILKQQLYFEQFLPRTPEREYVSGETHLYLGRKYLLKVRIGVANEAKLIGGVLLVTCKKSNNPAIVKKIVAQWYYIHAFRKFNAIKTEQFLKFNKHSIINPDLEIKRMSKRWGSCTANGKISVNPEIIKAPTKCIEYLMIHEMCHLIERNHTKKFYALLTQVMPDWEKWKDKLELKMA
jgi:hypothetical protein